MAAMARYDLHTHSTESDGTEPPADVVFTAFADSSINLLLRAWVPTPDVIIARSELIEAIHAEFNRRGISIPFPQRDVHLYPHPRAGSDAPA